MARFTFELEPVLRHRRMLEEQRQRELAESERQRVACESSLRSMQANISADKSTMAQALVGRVDVDRIGLHAAHAGRAEMRARQVAAQLAGLHHRVREARQRLMEATRQRRAIERLRDKRLEAWRQDQMRREANVLDELSVIAHARRGMKGVAS